MNEPRQLKVDSVSVERELAARRVHLHFAPEVEAQFEADTGRGRSRLLVYQSFAGVAIYLTYLLADYQLTADVFPIAAAIRLGAVIPLSLLGIAVLWFNPRPLVREGVVCSVSALAAFSTLAVVLLSRSPLRDAMLASVVLVVLYLTMVQRVRFRFAVATCLLLLAGFVAATYALPEYGPDRQGAAIQFLAASITLTLIGSWGLERETRRAYLLQLKERLANATLSDISLHDPMTALENRRALDGVLLAIVRQAGAGEHLAAVFLDIDHFKAFNDRLGHPAGDVALQRLAGVLQRSLRDKNDHAFRYGGEEFLVVLPRTNLVQAIALAERLRRAVEDEAILHPDAPGGVLTASFGVAAVKLDGPGGPAGVGNLVEDADAALYAAKRAGRNCVYPPLPAVQGAQASLT